KAAGSGAALTLEAAAATVDGTTYVFPAGPEGGEFLTVDGNGNMSWATPAGGGDTTKAENLAGLTDAAAARANLELGDAAPRDGGAAAGDVAAGDHGHADA